MQRQIEPETNDVPVINIQDAEWTVRNFQSSNQVQTQKDFSAKRRSNTEKRSVQHNQNINLTLVSKEKRCSMVMLGPDSKELSLMRRAKLNSKLRIIRAALVFIHRLKKRLEYVKTYGFTNHLLNPKITSNIERGKFTKSLDNSINVSMTSEECLLREHPNVLNMDRYLFFPYQIWYLLWNFLAVIVLVYLLIFEPFIVALESQGESSNIINFGLDFYFILDFLINFNLSFQKTDGFYETDRTKIAMRYFGNGFWLDMLAAFPVTWTLENTGLVGAGVAGLLRIAKLPKVYSTITRSRSFTLSAMIDIFKIPKIWTYKIKSKQNFVRIVFVVVRTYIIIHLASCVWIGLCRLPFTRTNNWEAAFGYSEDTAYSQYIASTYFIINTLATLGYGDILATNHFERVFCIFWMLFGISFYSYMIGYVTEYFLSNDDRLSLMNERLKRLDYFSLDRNVDKNLKGAIEQNIEYASNIIYYRWVEGEKNLFCGLPIELKFDFYKNIHPELVACPFFDSNNYFFTVSVIEKMKPVKVKRDQFVWLKGEPTNYIVFVVKGSLFLMMDNMFYKQDKNREALFSTPSKHTESKLKEALRTFQIKGILKDESGHLSKQKYTVQQYIRATEHGIESVADLPIVAFKKYSASAYIGEDDMISELSHQYYLKASTEAEIMILSRSDFDSTVKQSFPTIYKKIVEYSVKRNSDLIDCKKKLIKDISVHHKRTGFNLANQIGLSVAHRTVNLFEKEKERNRIVKYEDFLSSVHEKHPLQNLFEYCDNSELISMPELVAERPTLVNNRAVGPSKLYYEWYSWLIRT